MLKAQDSGGRPGLLSQCSFVYEAGLESNSHCLLQGRAGPGGTSRDGQDRAGRTGQGRASHDEVNGADDLSVCAVDGVAVMRLDPLSAVGGFLAYTRPNDTFTGQRADATNKH